MMKSISRPWTERPEIVVRTDQPMARWFADVPADLMREARGLVAGVVHQVAQVAPPGMIAALVEQTIEPRHAEECRAFAPMFDRQPADLLVTNASYDVIVGVMGCSTIAVPTADGPALARNLDWWPTEPLARASAAIRYQPGDDPSATSIILAGWPGGVGAVTGLSVRGSFALCLNAVSGIEPADPTGYPVLFLLRQALDSAADFAAAARMLRETKVAAPCLITLVGRENHERMVIERTPNHCGVREPENADDALVTTNDWRQLHEDVPVEWSGLLQATTCSRFDSLRDFLADHAADRVVDDEQLLWMLSDPSVVQGITAQHVIMRPRAGTLRVFAPRSLLA